MKNKPTGGVRLLKLIDGGLPFRGAVAGHIQRHMERNGERNHQGAHRRQLHVFRDMGMRELTSTPPPYCAVTTPLRMGLGRRSRLCITRYPAPIFYGLTAREQRELWLCMRRFKILPPPRCVYGEFRISTEHSPTIRARDYKDPIWVIEIYESIRSWKEQEQLQQR